MKNFALIGAAGYIAPRHMEAIKITGNNLVAILDKHDSVGIIDSYFPEASFFSEFEMFDRHIEKLRQSNLIDYVSICSPNYLHDSHIEFGLRMGASVICEKPLVINPDSLDYLEKVENKFDGKINCVLQLRLSESFKKMKKKIEDSDGVLDIDITYITSRGNWYSCSWKGDEKKSGGLIYNIGIHLFDMICCILGKPHDNIVHLRERNRVAGFLGFKKARIRWFLSIRDHDVPYNIKDSRMFRSIDINGEVFDMSFGFQNLHIKTYEKILEGQGFGISEARQAIELSNDIKKINVTGIKGDYHPLLIDSNFR